MSNNQTIIECAMELADLLHCPGSANMTVAELLENFKDLLRVTQRKQLDWSDEYDDEKAIAAVAEAESEGWEVFIGDEQIPDESMQYRYLDNDGRWRDRECDHLPFDCSEIKTLYCYRPKNPAPEENLETRLQRESEEAGSDRDWETTVVIKISILH